MAACRFCYLGTGGRAQPCESAVTHSFTTVPQDKVFGVSPVTCGANLREEKPAGPTCTQTLKHLESLRFMWENTDNVVTVSKLTL